MAEKTHRVKYRIDAEDATSRALASVKQNLSGVNSALMSMKGLLVAAAPAAVFQQIFQGAAEAERWSLRLDAALRATGNSAGILRGELDQIAEEVKVRTVFDDDEVRKGISSLLRFRDIQGDVFRDAARLAPDLAAALDIGLTEAYQRLGRALEDPTTGMRSLRDAGLNVRQTQVAVAESLDRTGDRARAQKIILDELTRSVGGAAAAENAGLFGASKAVGKAWDDMLKGLGKSETFTSIAHAGLDLIKRDLEAIKFLAESDAVQGAMGGPVKGRIGGAVSRISARDFGGETEQDARLREIQQAVDFFQKRGGGRGAGKGSTLDVGQQWMEDAEEWQKIMSEAAAATDKFRQKERELATETNFLEATQGRSREQMTAWYESIDAANALAIEHGAIISQDITPNHKRLEDQLNSNRDAARDLGLTFVSAFEDAIVEGKKFSDVLKALAIDVARIAVRQTVTKPLLGGISKLFDPNPVQGPTPSGGNIAGGSILSDFFSGLFKAEGGAVMGGRPYIVGEQGPELFVPGRSGAIVPNGAMPAGGSTFYIDARGANEQGLARLERMILAINGSLERRAVSAVANVAQRGGSLAAAIRGA